MTLSVGRDGRLALSRGAVGALSLATALALSAPARSAEADGRCPAAEEIVEYVSGLDLDSGFRGRVIGLSTDRRLVAKAASRPGRVVSRRHGETVHAVIVADVAPELLWLAIGDEGHFDDSGSMPLDGSAIVSRSDGGAVRSVFQHTRVLGSGRWWVSEVRVDADIHAASGGAMWEAHWSDPPRDPPLDGVENEEQADRLPRLADSSGAWLVIPLADACVMLDYVVKADPGGLMGYAQRLVAGRSVRRAANGVVEMAREHVAGCEQAEDAPPPDAVERQAAREAPRKERAPEPASRAPGRSPGS